MASMKSCFNGTLYRKNLKRFWPLMLVFFLVWMLSLCLPLAAQNLTETGSAYRLSLVAGSLFAMSRAYVPILGAIASTVTAWAVFSFLFSAKSVSAWHVLPLRREGLFFSSLLSGLTILFLPCVAVLAIVAGYESVCNAWEPISFGNLAAILFGVQFICFSIAALMAMLAGNAPGMLTLTAVANFLAPFLEATAKALGEQFLYGVYFYDISAVSLWLSPIYHVILVNDDYYVGYFTADDLPERETIIEGIPELWVYGVYALAAAALLVFALLLYKKRPLENAGSVLAFPALRPVFTVGAGLCLSLLMTLLVQSILNIEMRLPAALIMMAFWAFVGWFAALMVVRKSFRVFTKGAVAGWAGLTAAICLAMVLFCSVDILGLETWVPEADEVADAYVTVDAVSTDGSDEASIEAVLTMHKLVVGHLDEVKARDSMEDAGRYLSIYFHYTLKNGQTARRQYYYQMDTSLLEQPQTLEAGVWDYLADSDRAWHEDFGDAEVENITYGEVSYSEDILVGDETGDETETESGETATDIEIQGYRSGSATLTVEEAQALAAAIREDYDAGRSPYTSDLTGVSDYSGYSLYFSAVYPDENGDTESVGAEISVTNNMTSTLALMEELGLYGRITFTEEYYDIDYEMTYG